MLMAAAKAPRQGDDALRIDTIYDAERGRLKVILTGSIGTTVSLLKLVNTLTESRK